MNFLGVRSNLHPDRRDGGGGGAHAFLFALTTGVLFGGTNWFLCTGGSRVQNAPKRSFLSRCVRPPESAGTVDRISDALWTEAVLNVALYKEEARIHMSGESYRFVSTGAHPKWVILVMVMCDQEYSFVPRLLERPSGSFREKGGSKCR